MAAAVDLSIGDEVSIDGKGRATFIERNFRGFGSLYMVRLSESDFEVELPQERLHRLNTGQNSEQTQTDAARPSSSGASDRFKIVSDQDVDNFNFNQTNKNTLSKTIHDLKILREFLAEVGERREIQNIPQSELSSYLCLFIVGVKKRNGDDHEPSCIRGMLASFERQLRRCNYGDVIFSSPVFAKVRETLTLKQKELKSQGKGNLPNKRDPLTDQDIVQLWASGQLGEGTPDSILQTMWFYNNVHFELRSVQEHRDMCWGDIALARDDTGHEYLNFVERQTKTRTGTYPNNVLVVKPKLWANLEQPSMCPIAIYKQYAEIRPSGYSEPDSPFYIASTTIHSPSLNDLWFRRGPVGVNKISGFMKRMIQRAGISTNKHLSNHSARKLMIQKLSDSGVPANQIMQISGHRNIASINNYSHINERQHKTISSILHSTDTSDSHNITQNEVTRASSMPVQLTSISLKAASSSNINVTGGFHSIFAGQIHGGNFHVHIHNNSSEENSNSPARKRIRFTD